MSKRLRVLLADQEWAEISRLAKREHVTVGEWVRRALREAWAAQPVSDPETKLGALRIAAEYSFPTCDVKQMLDEIARGYES